MYTLISPRGNQFIRPGYEGPAVDIATWLLAVTMMIMVLSRLATKYVVMRKFQIDDYLIVAAMALGIGQSVATSQQASNGLGDGTKTLNASKANAFQKSYYASELLYIPTLCLTKLSLLAFIQGITPNRRHQRYIKGLGLFVVLSDIPLEFATAFQCGLPRPWEVLTLHCFNQKMFWYWVGVVNMLTDLLIFLMPVMLVWNLQMAPSRKLVVISCFAGRFLVIAATICRLVFLSKLRQGREQTFSLWTVVVCTQVEIFMTIFTASIPYVKPFFDGVESGLWRSDELRRRNLTVTDLYGIGSYKTGQYPMDTRLDNITSNEPSTFGPSQKIVKHHHDDISTSWTKPTATTLLPRPSDEIVLCRDEDDWGSHNSTGSRSRMFH